MREPVGHIGLSVEGCVLSRCGQKCIKALIACQRWCLGNSRFYDRLSGARKLVQPANDGAVGIRDIVDT